MATVQTCELYRLLGWWHDYVTTVLLRIEEVAEAEHLSPLQYAKSVKLDRAHTLIKEGKNASEAGYLVGYNSPAQFSREYKRYFVFAPSAT